MASGTNAGSDLRGALRVVIDATLAMTNLVEAVHCNAERPFAILPPIHAPVRGIRALAYRNVRGITRFVGTVIDTALARLTPWLGQDSRWPGRDALLAAVNGVLGDYLAAASNSLAIPMSLHHNGTVLDLPNLRSSGAIPQATDKIVVFVHGLCMNDRQWIREGHDYGSLLAHELGYTPVFLRYNSGCHISSNGQAFSQQLEMLVRHWPVPVESLVIIGHSMGGLLARSACHYAEKQKKVKWRKHLKTLIFIGTPHHGAPLERGGNWVDLILGSNPYTAPFARLGKIRSAAITDLRHGSLLDEDWQGRDRFERSDDRPQPVPLPAGVQCCTIAASTGKQAGDLNERLLGDGIVYLNSALGRHSDPARTLAFPDPQQFIAYGVNHLDVLYRPEVYAQIRRWLTSAA